MSQKSRYKNIEEIRNYLLEEINQNDLMNRMHKKVCTILNYIEHFLILASTIMGCISISASTSLLGIPVVITSSAIGIKKDKSIIKRKKKKHDKILLLAKSKLNSIEVLISKALIYSNINHDEFALINMLKEYDKMKEDLIKFIEGFRLFYKSMLSYSLKCRKNTKSKNPKKTKNRRMLLSKCAMCVIVKNRNLLESKNSWEQKSNLQIKTTLTKIPLVGPLLF